MGNYDFERDLNEFSVILFLVGIVYLVAAPLVYRQARQLAAAAAV